MKILYNPCPLKTELWFGEYITSLSVWLIVIFDVDINNICCQIYCLLWEKFEIYFIEMMRYL